MKYGVLRSLFFFKKKILERSSFSLKCGGCINNKIRDGMVQRLSWHRSGMTELLTQLLTLVNKMIVAKVCQ